MYRPASFPRGKVKLGGSFTGKDGLLVRIEVIIRSSARRVLSHLAFNVSLRYRSFGGWLRLRLRLRLLNRGIGVRHSISLQQTLTDVQIKLRRNGEPNHGSMRLSVLLRYYLLRLIRLLRPG